LSPDRRPPGEHAAPSDAEPPGGRWSRVLFPGETGRALARDVLTVLADAHPAENLWIALRVAPERQAAWAWAGRLPHTATLDAELATRPDFAPGVRPSPGEPVIVVVLDGADPGERLATRGVRNTVVLDLDDRRRRPGRTTLRLDTTADGLRVTWAATDRAERSASLPDARAAALLLLPGDPPRGVAARPDAPPRATGLAETGPWSSPAAGPRPGPAYPSDVRAWPPPQTRPAVRPRVPGDRSPADARRRPSPPAAGTGRPPSARQPIPVLPGASRLPSAPPAIDHLLPPLVPTRERGLTTATPFEGAPLTVPAGLLDRSSGDGLPGVLRVDLSGHLLIIGGAGSGKSTLATTLVIALALTRTPREAQFYCLDSGGALRPLNALPHVGAVADDPETARAVIAKLTALLDAPAPRRTDEHLFLVVDGPAPPEHEAVLGRLAADGLRHGIHLIVTAADRSAAALAAARELSLDGPHPGQGTDDGARFVTALPRLDGVESADDLDGAVSALVAEIAEQWGDRPGVPGVRPLPASVPAAGLPEPRHRLQAVLGVGAGDLAPVVHDFTTAPHLVIAGEAGSGKTNLLRLVARSITESHRPVEARILLVDYRGGLLHTMPEEFVLGHAFSAGVLGELVDGTARAIGERLAEPGTARDWQGPRLFILVDDYEPGDPAYGPLELLREYLPLGYELGAHLIVATAANSGDPFLDALLGAGAGALRLSGAPEPAGRARYHAGGVTSPIQTALD
jgi:hypothetical protein